MADETPDAMFEAIRRDLHELARSMMARERPSHTLQPTALLGEAWLRLFDAKGPAQAADRAELIGKAAVVMRHILVDHARARAARKRGGDHRRVPLDEVLDRCAARGLGASDVEEALGELAEVHPRPASAMTLRFIGGFSAEEIAAQLGICAGTVRNDLALARAWLSRQLEGCA